MERRFWDYLFWLHSIDMDIDDFVKRCDLQRAEMSLGDALSWWLQWEYEHREKNNLIQPWWLQGDDPPSSPGAS